MIVLVCQDDLGDAPVEGEGPDGDRQGGQSEPGDEDPVERAGDQAHHQDGDYGERERPAVREQVAEQGAGETQGRGHGKVDLARDHDQCQRQCHQRDRPDVQPEIEEVGAREEVVGLGHAVEHGGEHEPDQRHLPAAERLPPPSGRVASRGGRPASAGPSAKLGSGAPATVLPLLVTG